MRFAAIAGAALGLAVLIEFQAVLAGSVIALWGAFRLRRPAPLAAAALAGAVDAAGPAVAYNMLAFGTPFRLGYQGVNGFPGMNEGLFGLTSPKFAVLSEIIVGLRRGMLWVAPVLILDAVRAVAIGQAPARPGGHAGERGDRRAAGQRGVCLLGRRPFDRPAPCHPGDRAARDRARGVLGEPHLLVGARVRRGDPGRIGRDQPRHRRRQHHRARRIQFPALGSDPQDRLGDRHAAHPAERFPRLVAVRRGRALSRPRDPARPSLASDAAASATVTSRKPY